MTLQMSPAERERFLAEARVAIMSIAEPGRAALTAPVWYDYDPAVGVSVITAANSRKGTLLAQSGRYALCAQNDTPPGYRYVSVEGPVVETRKAELERDYRPISHRYFGVERGDAFADSSWSEDFYVYVMRPERWLSADYSESLSSGESG